jgi:transcriptional regulator with XRE-family HTH domain
MIINYLYIMLISLRLRADSCYFCPLITGRQLRAARALIGWEQITLAKRSRVAIGTIRRMESFGGEIGSRTSTLSQVQATLEKAGIEFLNHDSPGVRLRPLSSADRRKEPPRPGRRN